MASYKSLQQEAVTMKDSWVLSNFDFPQNWMLIEKICKAQMVESVFFEDKGYLCWFAC